MQLRDNTSNGPQSDHDDLWELIPWYVNGSLPATDVARLEARAKDSTALSEEIARQTLLAEKVAKTDPFEVPLERSWETLRAQVEADLKARTPAPRRFAWLAALQGHGKAALGGLAVACLALVMVVQLSTPAEDGFVTLTSTPDLDGPTIRFQPAGSVEADQLAALLAPMGVVAIAGPSDAGVYSAILEENANLDEVAAAMMAADQILFAAPEAGQ
ncbi:hypothetical protein [uncultured Roseobacter sp.]|uniref:hypothetical protein n=1 Tax=uncultured Roseobacter sp. TaxID=114847 RepID=UPI0026039604|nr:hypothetical protein [uncultured Roseobacter sp.]